MYISEEQKTLEKSDMDFKKKIKEAKEFINSTLASISDLQKLEYSEKLEKVKKSTYKSKRLKIDNGVLIKNSATCETVFIPFGVTEIGNEASKNSRSVKIIFPEGLKKIGVSAFEDATSVLYMDVKDADLCYPAEAVSLVGAGDEIDQFPRGFSQFPDTLEEIGDHAFRCIGKEAYSYNKKLMGYLIIPKTLQKIGKGAFTDYGIVSVYIAGPEKVSEACFSGSRRLKLVIFGDKVKTIDKLAFDACAAIEKVVFSKGLKEINDCAFAGCISIKRITLPDTLGKIGNFAFCECQSISSIVIPNSVTQIGERAFFKCSNLKKVKLGESITTICAGCFADCIKLSKIEISNNVTVIAGDAFKNCKKVVICAPAGSYAEQYAKENNIKFEAI